MSGGSGFSLNGQPELPSIAVYVTTDDAYVFPAIVTIESVRKNVRLTSSLARGGQQPKVDYFCLTTADGISAENRQVLGRFGILVVEARWASGLQQESHYPNVAYAMLEGPEIFYSLGYSRSLGLDSDVMCLRGIHLDEIFQQISTFGGIVNGGDSLLNLRNAESRKDFFDYCDDGIQRFHPLGQTPHTNTGVMFWNNQWAADFKLTQKAHELFERFGEALVAADQSLMALVAMKFDIPYLHLEIGFNYRLGNEKDIGREASPTFVHFTGPSKPWSRPAGLRKVISHQMKRRNSEHLHYKRVWYKMANGIAASGAEDIRGGFLRKKVALKRK